MYSMGEEKEITTFTMQLDSCHNVLNTVLQY